MKKPSILVVEDDTDIQQLVSYNLIKAGFNVTCADTGEEALQKLGREAFDAMVLDLMLPGKDGHEVCRVVRSQENIKGLPIVMLTAKSEEDDIVSGLECGADDYVTKPFSPRVLIARLEASIRRKPEAGGALEEEVGFISRHGMEIHSGRHEVRVNGEEVHLTASEFTILELMAGRPGWVFSRQQIIDQVRGYDYSITPRAVDVQIFGLRKKLGSAGACIETVRGIGYRIRE
ncbi:response regulator transcription factor [Desulfobulbus rhabdoformis]|uniref:response regulator n=1 Tax=Desulfobulbus rhabdoformis TaxID=34032 RepID=UPI001965D775|nr:response regulator transcription factor [Desulfobulbus rhabdoformis]